MAKAILKLGEYLNFFTEINAVALEIFHDKKNMRWEVTEFIFLSKTILYKIKYDPTKLSMTFPNLRAKLQTKLCLLYMLQLMCFHYV